MRMRMSEQAILRDALESLKHMSAQYLWASFECDSDNLRRTCQRIAIDKAEERNAVFNLMHQAEMEHTAPADADRLQRLREQARRSVQQAGGPQYAVSREYGSSPSVEHPRQ